VDNFFGMKANLISQSRQTYQKAKELLAKVKQKTYYK
jgi:hypothetical protein